MNTNQLKLESRRCLLRPKKRIVQRQNQTDLTSAVDLPKPPHLSGWVRPLVFALVSATLSTSLLHAQGDSSARTPNRPVAEAIQGAITRGLRSRQWEGAESRSTWIGAKYKGFHVTLEGPFNRVANAAAANAKKYLPFTIDGVAAEILAPVLRVVATPWPPYNSSGEWNITPEATHMVIAFGGQDQEQIVQPAKVEAFAVSWGNAAGGQFSGRGV
jgi:hypothetical protein